MEVSMWFGHGFGWGGMIFGGLFMLLLWGGFFALIFWGIKLLTDRGSSLRDQSSQQGFSAREILDQRYARGEINREEYELIRADLVN
jgi:putative membrane protein